MKNNPWYGFDPHNYDAHMSHPNVLQTQTLSQIMKEQFELIHTSIRHVSFVAILGITNGSGLEHVIPCDVGYVIGIDINQNFLDECTKRFPDLKDRLRLYQMDLMEETANAVGVLSKCNLIIADLFIEHIHLDNFTKIMKGLLKHKPVVSCVIQVNPDGSIVSKSGAEHTFADVVKQVEEENETALVKAMKDSGYSLNTKKLYGLPNGKQFIRLDFSVV